MYGLLVGTGKYSQRINKENFLSISPEGTIPDYWLDDGFFSCISYIPGNRSTGFKRVASIEDRITVILDGYIIHKEGGATLQDNLEKIIHDIEHGGLFYAMNHVVAGSFNLLVRNYKDDSLCIVNDAFGANPIYKYEDNDGDIILCSHLSIVRRLDISNLEVDLIGCAEFIYFGHSIHNRTFLSRVNQLEAGSVYSMLKNQRIIKQKYASLEFDINYSLTNNEIIDQLDLLFGKSLDRIHTLSGKTANLQSAGMDSRLITAAWPESAQIDCYTYGNYGSYEVAVAEMVAGHRHSEFHHSRPDGDTIAMILNEVFDTVDNYIYPDRFFIAQKIASDGADSILDGYLGDVIFGGTYFSNDKYFNNRLARSLRFLTILNDSPLGKTSTEELSHSLFQEMLTIDDSDVERFFNAEFSDALVKVKEDILNDIHEEISSLKTNSDSVAILFRNFKILNRGRMSIVKQGVNCRKFVETYYPFTNDNDLIRFALSIPPGKIAYRRLYIELFNKYFPDYSKIPLGSSEIALKYPSLVHKWSMILMDRGLTIPLIHANDKRLKPSPNNWSAWLSESSTLRNQILAHFKTSEYGNFESMDKLLGTSEFHGIGRTGKILHVAGVLKWLSLYPT